MAVIGYVLGIVFALLLDMPKILLQIYFTYLITDVLILISNHVVKVKASRHTCGVAGPIVFLIYLFVMARYSRACVLVLVYWVSLRMQSHTLSELLWGSSIPIVAWLLSIIIVPLT